MKKTQFLLRETGSVCVHIDSSLQRIELPSGPLKVISTLAW